jgi:hypothetical protein
MFHAESLFSFFPLITAARGQPDVTFADTPVEVNGVNNVI